MDIKYHAFQKAQREEEEIYRRLGEDNERRRREHMDDLIYKELCKRGMHTTEPEDEGEEYHDISI